MPLTAPMIAPVELRLAGKRTRWFRLASAVSDEGLLFARPLPEEIDGPVEVSFHLPEDPRPIELDARPIEVQPQRRKRDEDEAPKKSAVRFIRPDEEARSRILRYVEARLEP
jgi:hypothetical protein